MATSYWFRSALDLVFPRSCHACHRPLRGETNPCFCNGCWSDLDLLAGPCCPSCGKPFLSALALSYSPMHRCGDCRERAPRFDQAVAAGRYEGVMAIAIRLFKYQGKTNLAGPLAGLMVQRINRLPSVDGLVPVPLDSSRLRERLYNQSLLLCDAVHRKTGIEVIPDGLERIRFTAPQAGLSLKERRRNVRRAFSVKRAARVKGRRILLIDDVVTTGATVNECARMLKKAGAKRVTVLTVARVDLPSSGGSWVHPIQETIQVTAQSP